MDMATPAAASLSCLIIDRRFKIADVRFGAAEGGRVNKEELKTRTKQFALRIIRLVESFPRTSTARTIGRQLLRSGTSVGASYRAACQARTRADYISKVGIAIDEADKSLYWMELVVDAKVIPAEKLTALTKEANEIVAVLPATTRTARPRLKPRRSR